MYICLCNSVTDRDIQNAAERGVRSMSGLSKELNVATCCGCCKDCAKEVLNEAVASQDMQQAMALAIPA